MRVCLITPPSDFLLDQRVFMSLGILRVGAVLERAGVEVDHLDLSGVTNFGQVVDDYLGHGCFTFAITATTPQLPAAVQIAKLLRKRGKGTKIIIGGPHATLIVAAAKQGSHRAGLAVAGLMEYFDCVVAGDGEKSILLAIRGTEQLIDADDPKSPLWLSSEEYENMPWAARHLVDVDSYHYEVDGKRAHSMIAQLGCPFECNFCGGRFSPMLRRIRTRASRSVVSEMVHLHETYGVEALMFFDDELNVNKGVVGLMREIKATGIDWRLRGFVKAELFTDEQAEAMYVAGFRWLLCGFESAHPKILRNINKKATREENTRMLRTAHKHGLKVKALMSIGHPGENEETIEATRRWLIEEKPDDFDVTVITVYPGTPYYDKAEETSTGYCYQTHGDRLYSENVDFSKDAQYYKGVPGDYRSYVWTDYLTGKEIEVLRDDVEKDVRQKLAIPYPSGAAALNYEHSMGMSIPSSILRRAAAQ